MKHMVIFVKDCTGMEFNMRLIMHEQQDLEKPEVTISYREINDSVKRVVDFVRQVDQTICCRKDNEEYFIPARDIYYVESEGHTLRYHTKNGIIVSSGTMKSAEEMLGKSHFSRGNKGYLINLEHVEGVKDKCAQINGEHLLLSRQGMKKFMQDLTRYWGEME